MFPVVAAPELNVYYDIYQWFLLVKNELILKGSFRLEKMKEWLIPCVDDICAFAYRCHTVMYLPMDKPRINQWDRPLSRMESRKVQEILFYLQACSSLVS